MSTLFIGLGRMGATMVRRYALTHPTVLHDVNRVTAASLADELNAPAIDSLDDLSSDVDTVILMLPNSGAVESVLVGGQGILGRLPKGSLVIDMGSSEPGSTRMLAAEASKRGTAYVDAPVSGGVSKAATGELTIMAGGSVVAIEQATEHLAPFGTHIVRVGGSGSGHAMKALNNLLSASNLAAAAEVFTVAKNFGIRADIIVSVINASTGRSQATEVKYPRHVMTGTFDSGFSMDLMLKDLTIANNLGRNLGLTTPITDKVIETLTAARQSIGGADPDHTEVVRFYELVNHAVLRLHDD